MFFSADCTVVLFLCSASNANMSEYIKLGFIQNVLKYI